MNLFVNKYLKKAVAGMMALSMLLQAAPAQLLAEEDSGELSIAVISDLHVMPPSLWSDSEDAQAAIASDRKMFAESTAIFDAAIEKVKAQKPDVVIIPGDLTKDGEYAAHQYVAEKLAALEAAVPETKVYVINGNHDINNPNAFDYAAGEAVPAKRTSPEEYRAIYEAFGYGVDTEKFVPTTGAAGSNSYVARPAEGFTVIAIDSGKYSADATASGEDIQETGGNIPAELLDWVLEKTAEAEARGDSVISFMHHGVVPHFSMQSELLGDYLVDNYTEAGEKFADAGLRYFFTGHMHAQNISQMTTDAGNTIYDIETGSLVTYPSPIRFVSMTKGVNEEGKKTETLDVKSELIKEIDFIDKETGEKITDLTDYGYRNSINEETVAGLVMSAVGGDLIGGLLDQVLNTEFVNTNGETSTGLKGFIESLLSAETGNDLDEFVLSMVHDLLPQTLEEGIEFSIEEPLSLTITIYYDAANERITASTMGGAALLYITDENLINHLLDPIITQVDEEVLGDSALVQEVVSNVLNKAVMTGVYPLPTMNEDGTINPAGDEHTLFELAKYIYLSHLRGDAVSEPWIDEVIESLETGAMTDYLVQQLLTVAGDELALHLDLINVDFMAVLTGNPLGNYAKGLIAEQLGDNLGGVIDLAGLEVGPLLGDLGGGLIPADLKQELGGLVINVADSFLAGSNDNTGDNNTVITWVGGEAPTPPDPVEGKSVIEVKANDVKNTNGATTVSGQIFNIEGTPVTAHVELHGGLTYSPYRLAQMESFPTEDDGTYTYEVPTGSNLIPVNRAGELELRIKVTRGSEYEYVEVPVTVKAGYNSTVNVNIARIIDDLSVSENNGDGGWFAGDAHQHSHYSDGAPWETIDEIVRQNVASGNHWGILTDHRNNDGNEEFRELMLSKDTDFAGNDGIISPVAGYEWTSNNGHMNVYGPYFVVDELEHGDSEFPGLDDEARNAEHLRRVLDIQAAGAFVQANHPTSIEFMNHIEDFRDYWFADAIEIWNVSETPIYLGEPHDGEAIYGARSYSKWFDLLNNGARTPVTATTDSHNIDFSDKVLFEAGGMEIPVKMVGELVASMIDENGVLIEEGYNQTFDLLYTLLGGSGGLGDLDLPGELDAIIPQAVLDALQNGTVEEARAAVKEALTELIPTALPKIVDFAQSGLSNGETKTYAYLPDGFTIEALQDALRNGTSFQTNGPVLFAELNDQMPDNRYGNEAVLNADGTATLSLDITSNRELDYIFVMANGEVLEKIEVDGKAFKEDIEIDLNGKEWIVIEAWGERDARAFTNPIFITTPERAEDKAAKAELISLIKETLKDNPTTQLVGFDDTLSEEIVALKAMIDEATEVLFDLDATKEEVNAAIALLRDEEAETFTVTFDSNGGDAVAPVTVESGKTITAPTNPTWYNHVFVGWYLDDVRFDFEKNPITGDLTLTAKWLEKATIEPAALSKITKNDPITLSCVTPGAKIFYYTNSPSDATAPEYREYTGSFTIDEFMPWPSGNYVNVYVVTELDGVRDKYAKNFLLYEDPNAPVEPVDPVEYTVTVNGSYAADTGAGDYEAGDTVTINAGERSGYTFEGWTADGVTLINPNDAETTFEMPEQDVEVTAEWDEDNGDDGGGNGGGNSGGRGGNGIKVSNEPVETAETVPVPTPAPVIQQPDPVPLAPVEPAEETSYYNDVISDAWFYDAVMYVTENQWMNGTGNDRFEPDTTISRAMFAQMLYNYAGSPAVTGDSPFTDVQAGAWYADAVIWASNEGIISGYGNGQYGPNDVITREQMVVLFYQFAGAQGLDTSAAADLTSYTDAGDISDWALAAVQWAVETEIMQGRTDTALAPQGTATRAEAATLFMQFVELNN